MKDLLKTGKAGKKEENCSRKQGEVKGEVKMFQKFWQEKKATTIKKKSYVGDRHEI